MGGKGPAEIHALRGPCMTHYQASVSGEASSTVLMDGREDVALWSCHRWQTIRCIIEQDPERRLPWPAHLSVG